MKQENKNIQHQEDIKKLTFVVVFLSLFVIALFGLVPLA
jgi:hypothetical protein